MAEFAPEQAAKWRCDAGGGLSEAAMNDLWLHDHQFVADKQREQSSAVEKRLAWMDAQADKMRRFREGDKAVDAANAKAAEDLQACDGEGRHVEGSNS